jgi:tRNA-2-methylthio-N6-dimethylallyladenosine synthase
MPVFIVNMALLSESVLATSMAFLFLNEIPDIKWLRFVSSHPKDLSEKLIALFAANPRICRHLHLPVQHGSDPILKRMNRKYTRGMYLDLVSRIRGAVPEISLSTDLLIGFPGETKQDFQDTLDLVREVEFSDAFTYSVI